LKGCISICSAALAGAGVTPCFVVVGVSDAILGLFAIKFIGGLKDEQEQNSQTQHLPDAFGGTALDGVDQRDGR
jgi:hypothetical protein